jgi:predicted RND superfamily exporter protein
MMSQLRNNIEKWFERFALLIYRNRIKTIVLMLCITLAIVSQIPRITIDTSMEGFLHKDDPAFLAYNAFRDQFGRDEVVIVALQPAKVFEHSFLKTLESLHEDLEENVPYIDDITSMVNARNTRGEGNELIVEDLLENWPASDKEMAVLKARVMSNPVYRNLMISEDGRLTTIIIRTHSHSGMGEETDLLEGFDNEVESANQPAPSESRQRTYLTDEENSEVVHAVQSIVQKYRQPDLPIWVAGSPVVTHFLKQSMMADMRKFVLTATATAAVILFIMFRRISGVFLPLLVVFSSLLTTIGLMAICGVPIKVPTQILPSFLLAVGVGTSVHILAIFYHRYRKSGDKKDAIAYAMGHSGLAIVMTNVTTASGLASFSTAELAPIADLGLFAAVGVLLAFINTVFLLPALLSLLPISHKTAHHDKKKQSVTGKFLEAIGNFSTGHPILIVSISTIAILLSAAAISTIRFSHHPLSWFPKDNDIRAATEKIDQELKGSISLEVIVDTGKENGLYDPALLERLESAAGYVQKLEYEKLYVGKAWSLTTILMEIHQALNENRSEYYRIPRDRNLIAQEFLLFENSGSDDLEDFVDSQFSKARFMIKVPFEDAYHAGIFIEQVNEHFEQFFPEAEVTLTGMIGLLSRTITAAIHSMAKSYAIALVVITVLMILLIGRIRIGLLSMIPNLAPILLMLGVIGFFGLPMDLFTMMVASIAIGLAVDDTIHFMHNFRRYYEHSSDPVKAVHDTLQTTGRAMLVTTVVLSIGFFIFGFATMSNVRNFGILTGFTIVMALLADYFLAPALMVLVNKKKQEPVHKNLIHRRGAENTEI